VLIALMACLFTASCVAELARELPAAGSVATYAAQGLHPAVGFLVGWGYVFVEALVPPLLLLQLGFTTAGTLHEEWSSYPADLWWPWALAGAAIIAAAGYFGVRASARFGTVLGVFEILVLLVFALWLIGKAGGNNTLSRDPCTRCWPSPGSRPRRRSPRRPAIRAGRCIARSSARRSPSDCSTSSRPTP
jgi:amino acid transporter